MPKKGPWKVRCIRMGCGHIDKTHMDNHISKEVGGCLKCECSGYRPIEVEK